MKTNKMYGLRHKKTQKLMAVSVHTVPEDVEAPSSHYFSLTPWSVFDQVLYLVDSEEKARYASSVNTAWYAADYETPENDYVGDLEVVCIEMSITPA